MKVLSLFDGMSCGQLALTQLGIKIDKYYASEIDKYAIQITQKNFPDTIQIGDVCNIKSEDYKDVDLILAGSPCQGFSFAGNQLAFDDPRSALFFEFIRLLKEIKPKYFLLENVNMKKEFLDIISREVSRCYPELPFGFERIKINSSLVSAQNRVRWYWTNISNVTYPEERGIVIRDILETTVLKQFKIKDETVPKYVPNEEGDFCDPYNKKMIKGDKSTTLRTNSSNGNTWIKQTSYNPQRVGTHVEQVKVRKHEVDITALQYLLREMKVESKKTNRQIAEETNLPITKVEHWFRTDSSFAIPSDDVWFKLKEVLGIQTEVFDKPIMEFEYRDGVYESTQRVYGDHGKSPTLTASNSDQLIQTSDKPQKIHDIPKDVLKDNERQRRVYSKEGKSPTLLARSDSPKVMKSDKPEHIGTAVDVNGHDILKRVYSPDGKSPTVNTMGGGNREPKVVVGAYRGRYNEDGSTSQKLELRKDEKTNTITTVQKDNVLTQDEVYWRKLTPLECMRLQTVQDDYLMPVSNTQKYKLLGNGWTIEVIAHILKNMEV
jgi:DNA-cytosine methyltransferase